MEVGNSRVLPLWEGNELVASTLDNGKRDKIRHYQDEVSIPII
jgi:hypothetical protein